jgi:hypothetical protein
MAINIVLLTTGDYNDKGTTDVSVSEVWGHACLQNLPLFEKQEQKPC